jgi:hypothetical protein
MKKKARYPLVAPVRIIEQMNEDCICLDDLEEFMPGITKGVWRLNKVALVFAPVTFADDEGLAAWVYGFDEDDGKFYVSADQPHYLHKDKRFTYVWDGKEFVRAKGRRKV